jgi:hypothetical protein
MEETLKRFVRNRAQARCEYCRLPENVSGLLPFHIEHIRARQHRGSDDPDNLCWACSRCNNLKGPNPSAFDPLTDELVRLFNPRRDSWEQHFRWEAAVIVGITAEGRATIDLLQMNEERRLRLRIALLENDEL